MLHGVGKVSTSHALQRIIRLAKDLKVVTVGAMERRIM